MQSDALFLQRSTPHDRVIITDSANHTLLNANEFDLGISAGWDISLMRQNILGSPWSIEGVYFGLDGWNAERGVERSAKGAVIRFIDPIGNIRYPVDVSASYRSALHNVELNAWRPVGNWGRLLIGFRYLDLSENSLNLYDTVIAPTPNPSVTRIDANNYLSGFQVGFDSVLWSRTDGPWKAA